MSITFYPSQKGGPTTKAPIAYTGNPLQLLWSDLCLIWHQRRTVGGILLPLRYFELTEFDELYPSPKNIVAIVTHAALVIFQLIFLASLFICLFVPVWAFFLWTTICLAINYCICRFILNGDGHPLTSSRGVKEGAQDQSEYWIYLNGVSVGRDWLQANIDRLSLTFGRKIVGILNPTDGIIFDLIQCMVQRNLCYSTQDIRDCYALIKEALLNEKYQKVVFILHSQGGIEGGLVLDWLLDEIPQDRLQRLEVYTFGNAANHFNNPHRTTVSAPKGIQLNVRAAKHSAKHSKALRYIEHYANAGDFVARFGVLNFTQVSNRFMGRVFKNPKSGHLLNMHYLTEMFPLETTNGVTRAKDVSNFMEMELTGDAEATEEREDLFTAILSSDTQSEIPEKAMVEDINSPISPLVVRSPNSIGSSMESRAPALWKVKHFSRLWMYRNGGSPPEDKDFGILPRATI